MENPFYITGIIPEAYFCDREKETDKLVTLLENQSNVLLTAYRRMGKTQLIRHLFEQPRIKDHYYTFYIDLYATSSLREMAYFMGKEIYRTLVPGQKRSWYLFFSTLQSIAAGFSIDPVTGVPTAKLQLGDIHAPELTLEEIFSYLEKADKPCIFAIDEFQQIAKYNDPQVEELLRTYIQKMNNCHFIFSGSDRHILEQMFHSYAKPFYNSAKPVFLDVIPKDIYTDFVIRCFGNQVHPRVPFLQQVQVDLQPLRKLRRKRDPVSFQHGSYFVLHIFLTAADAGISSPSICTRPALPARGS